MIDAARLTEAETVRVTEALGEASAPLQRHGFGTLTPEGRLVKIQQREPPTPVELQSAAA